MQESTTPEYTFDGDVHVFLFTRPRDKSTVTVMMREDGSVQLVEDPTPSRNNPIYHEYREQAQFFEQFPEIAKKIREIVMQRMYRTVDHVVKLQFDQYVQEINENMYR